MISFFKRSIIAIALLVGMMGCTTKDTLPSVIAVSPVGDATNVDVKPTITANFNLAMNSTTITKDSFFLVRSDDSSATHIDGTVTYLTGVATFTPTNPLAHNTKYKVTIAGTVQNLNSDAMGGDYVWYFTTGSGAGAKFSIFTSAGGAFSSSAVYNKTDYLVGMQRSGSNKILVRSVNAFGNITGFSGTVGGAPAMAFDGTKSMVVWSDSNKVIQGATIDLANVVTNLSPISGTTQANDIGAQSVICNSLECAVAWSDSSAFKGYLTTRSSIVNCEIAAKEITDTTAYPAAEISMASNGNTYLVAWDTGTKIQGSIYSPCGLTNVYSNINIRTKSLGTVRSHVGIAFNDKNDNYLIAWNEANDSASSTASTIRGQLIDENGNKVGVEAFNIIPANDPAATSPKSWKAVNPSIAFDGANYLVVWTDGRNAGNDDVYGQYIDASGALVGSEFVINSDDGNQSGYVTGYDSTTKSYLVTINSSGKVYGVSIKP